MRYREDELTPRRVVALRNKLQRSRVMVCKLRKKYQRLQGDTTSDDVMGKMKKALSPAAFSLLSRNMKICRRSKFGRRLNDLD
jgi:hypothetical protein